jgi:hypothetical protein
MKVVFSLVFVTFLFSEKFYYKENKKVVLTPVISPKSGEYTYYKTPQNRVVGVGKNIIVNFKRGDIQNYLKEYNLTIIKKLSNNTYLLKTSSNTLDISNRLSLDENISYSEPDFLKSIIKR